MLKKITPLIIALLFMPLAGLAVNQFSSAMVSAQAGEEPGREQGQQARTVDPVKVEGTCQTLDKNSCPIIGYLITFINILGGMVGIIVVVVIAAAGVQYTTSRDNPQVVAAARQRIYNALIALVAYMILIGFLEWVVPGGIFR